MHNPNRIAFIYGYLICLVAVITFIVTVGGLIQALTDAGHPLQSKDFLYQTTSLTSFDNYVLEKRQRSGMDTMQKAMVADTSILRRMYDAETNDLLQKANHRIRQKIIVNGSLLLLTVLLFVIHWRWLKKIAKNN